MLRRMLVSPETLVFKISVLDFWLRVQWREKKKAQNSKPEKHQYGLIWKPENPAFHFGRVFSFNSIPGSGFISFKNPTLTRLDQILHYYIYFLYFFHTAKFPALHPLFLFFAPFRTQLAISLKSLRNYDHQPAAATLLRLSPATAKDVLPGLPWQDIGVRELKTYTNYWPESSSSFPPIDH